MHDSQRQCCFLRRGYPESSTCARKFAARTVPSFTAELETLRKKMKNGFVFLIFCIFFLQSLEAKVMEISLLGFFG